MNRTVSLVDLSEKALRAAGILYAGFPKIAEELQEMAADMLIAAAENGEMAVSELDGLRDDPESSGGRNAAAPSVPVTGTRPMRIHLPAVPDGVTGAPRAVADPGRVIAEATARHNLGTGVVS